MSGVESTVETDDYDEFGLLHENAEEMGIPFPGRPEVSRGFVEVEPGRRLSYIRWGSADPEVVFLHGGAQNAHTWDYVALALGRPAVAFDLPGHGHSYWRDDRDYGPWRNAEALEVAVAAVAPAAQVVVGMSLGGMTTIRLAATRPDLCRRVVIVDVTPQVGDPNRSMSAADRGAVALVDGPPTYASFEEMAQAAIALSPRRAPSGVRRGVRHNARRLPDGRWTWRHDLYGPRRTEGSGGGGADGGDRGGKWPDLTALWADVEKITAPTLLVRGGESKFVRDSDVEEFRRRLPSLRHAVVEGAGHSVQSDRPLELVALIRDFAFAS